MTTDYAAIENFLRGLGPYDMPVGGTAIGRALTASKRLLERARGAEPKNPEDKAERPDQVVILMTDGEDHEGDPVAAAQALHDQGVRVFVVGIGSKTGEPIPTYAPDGTFTGHLRDAEGNPVLTALTAANEEQLEQIAEVSHGRYFRAPRGQVGVDQIRHELRQLRQHENESRRVTVHEARYALALLPALLLLLFESILPDAWIGRRRRKPAPERKRRRKGRKGEAST
jgi:Ca-activated chloride channel family protein